jgi:hypothetical protein
MHKRSLSTRANIAITMLDSLYSNLKCSDGSSAPSSTPKLQAQLMLIRERERESSSCVETFYSLNVADRHINRKSLPLPVHLTWTT